MKTLGKLKLNQLNKEELENETLKVLKGGRCSDCDDVCANAGGPNHSNWDLMEYNKKNYGGY